MQAISSKAGPNYLADQFLIFGPTNQSSRTVSTYTT